MEGVDIGIRETGLMASRKVGDVRGGQGPGWSVGGMLANEALAIREDLRLESQDALGFRAPFAPSRLHIASDGLRPLHFHSLNFPSPHTMTFFMILSGFYGLLHVDEMTLPDSVAKLGPLQRLVLFPPRHRCPSAAHKAGRTHEDHEALFPGPGGSPMADDRAMPLPKFGVGQSRRCPPRDSSAIRQRKPNLSS